MTPALGGRVLEAEAFVDGQKTEGATNLYDALALAFQDGNVDTIYVLSDGQPNQGEIKDPDALLAWVRRANAARGVVIHTVSAGELREEGFLRKMAEQNGGTGSELEN